MIPSFADGCTYAYVLSSVLLEVKMLRRAARKE
jgi:hypothetical protein